MKNIILYLVLVFTIFSTSCSSDYNEFIENFDGEFNGIYIGEYTTTGEYTVKKHLKCTINGKFVTFDLENKFTLYGYINDGDIYAYHKTEDFYIVAYLGYGGNITGTYSGYLQPTDEYYSGTIEAKIEQTSLFE